MKAEIDELKVWILMNAPASVTCGEMREKFEILDRAVSCTPKPEAVKPGVNRFGNTVCGNCRAAFGNGFAYDKWNYCPRCGAGILMAERKAESTDGNQNA